MMLVIMVIDSTRNEIVPFYCFFGVVVVVVVVVVVFILGVVHGPRVVISLYQTGKMWTVVDDSCDIGNECQVMRMRLETDPELRHWGSTLTPDKGFVIR